jgi:hypothetical protein
MSCSPLKAPPRPSFSTGDRWLVRGLNSRPELNGTIVEVAKQHRNVPVDRVAVRPCFAKGEGVIAVRWQNLVRCETEWRADLEEENCKAFGGASGYSKTKLYVFGGTEEMGDDDHSDVGTAPTGELLSFDYNTRVWAMHWRPDLPQTWEGSPQCDFSVGPPWRERAGSGALLPWRDPVTGREVLLFYSSPPERVVREGDEGMPRSFDVNGGEEDVDCIWVFRMPGLRGIEDIGYWVKVPTAGSKPTSFLSAEQLNHYDTARDCRAVLLPDSNGDGVRLIFWGGHYWSPSSDDGKEAALASVAMNGLFELHIPASHLDVISAGDDVPPPRWSLLPQNGTTRPMVRHDHTFSQVGRDLVVIGGEAVQGQPAQLPHIVGTDLDLGNYAYNLDTKEWRRLHFAPFGTASKPLECISDHLAFPLPLDALSLEMLRSCREALLTAIMCCRSTGLLPSDRDIWRTVWSYLAPAGRGQVLVVRQYDDIYRHASEEEEFDNPVMIYDLFNMDVRPLSTFSSSHNGRSPKDVTTRGRPLLGLGTHWFNAAIYSEPSKSESLRLLIHGRVTDDEEDEDNSRFGISWTYNGSMYSSEVY